MPHALPARAPTSPPATFRPTSTRESCPALHPRAWGGRLGLLRLRGQQSVQVLAGSSKAALCGAKNLLLQRACSAHTAAPFPLCPHRLRRAGRARGHWLGRVFRGGRLGTWLGSVRALSKLACKFWFPPRRLPQILAPAPAYRGWRRRAGCFGPASSLSVSLYLSLSHAHTHAARKHASSLTLSPIAHTHPPHPLSRM